MPDLQAFFGFLFKAEFGLCFDRGQVAFVPSIQRAELNVPHVSYPKHIYCVKRLEWLSLPMQSLYYVSPACFICHFVPVGSSQCLLAYHCPSKFPSDASTTRFQGGDISIMPDLHVFF